MTHMKPLPGQTAWVVAAKMGLGHQRAAYPLKDLSGGKILIAGDPEYSTPNENKLWNRMRQIYEGISRINHIPVIGGFLFGLLERLEEIHPYYPYKDLSKPTLQVNYLDSLVQKGLGETMVKMMRQEQPLPLVSTFFATAMAADHLKYPENYLLVTDTDINRIWVAKDPKLSRIVYLAPCGRALRRLKQYGVPDDRIVLTGFPLPKENLGGPDLDILKKDLAQRLFYLDPALQFWSIHSNEVEHYLGSENCVPRRNRCFNLTFAVGGAGAQKEIGFQILNSLRQKILNDEIRINLVAGIRSEIQDYFLTCLDRLDMNRSLGAGVTILYHPDTEEYFRQFNQLLRVTDVLWTKPSELTFYCALGIPLIIAPPLGPHEHYNKKWLLDHQAGIPQENPAYCNEWLFDLLGEGQLARAAWQGFLNTRKYGTYKIEELLTTGLINRDPSPLKR